ncbi:unnamed protein product [Discosporangium mesarthrocarpum]
MASVIRSGALALLAVAVVMMLSTARAFMLGPVALAPHAPASMTSSSTSRATRAVFRMSTTDAVEQKGLVTVYHKSTCPYCKEAFQLLEGEYGLAVTKVDVLEGEDSEKKIKQMKTFSGRNTVPQIFFNSEHLGGNDDVQTLHKEGKLEELVNKVRSEEPSMMKPNWYHPWY